MLYKYLTLPFFVVQVVGFYKNTAGGEALSLSGLVYDGSIVFFCYPVVSYDNAFLCEYQQTTSFVFIFYFNITSEAIYLSQFALKAIF